MKILAKAGAHLLPVSLVAIVVSAVAAACSSANHATSSSTTTDTTATGGDGGGGQSTSTSSLDGGGDGGQDGDAGAASCAQYLGGPGATSKWVSVDANGKLAYAKTKTGDTILDFSYAGYMGGGVPIPTVPAMAMVSPSSGDDTANIQAAIDKVAALPLTGGVRGAVELAAGTFHVGGTVKITASGVVLRGAGSGQSGGPVTEVQITGTPTAQQAFLLIEGTGNYQTTGTAAKITDSYVPSGATSFSVDDATGLAVGDAVVVERPVTQAWVHFMGMDTLVRNGMAQTWISAGSVAMADRTITAISGKQITVDVPLADSYDAQYLSPPGASVSRYTFAGRISQVGFESMKLVAPPSTTDISQPHFELLSMTAVSDGWVRDVAAQDFVGAGGSGNVVVGGNCRRVTIEDVALTHTVSQDQDAGAPLDYGMKGTQTLVLRSSSVGDHLFSVVTHPLVTGPIVALDFSATGTSTNLAPHQRWAVGLLVDRAKLQGGLDFMNRGIDGSGHGWTIGFAVAWNSTADTLLIQEPPGATNWAIGCEGTETTAAAPGSTTVLPQGMIDSQGKPVAPSSLYLAQLCERLGPGAVAAIGY